MRIQFLLQSVPLSARCLVHGYRELALARAVAAVVDRRARHCGLANREAAAGGRVAGDGDLRVDSVPGGRGVERDGRARRLVRRPCHNVLAGADLRWCGVADIDVEAARALVAVAVNCGAGDLGGTQWERPARQGLATGLDRAVDAVAGGRVRELAETAAQVSLERFKRDLRRGL